MPSAHLRLLIHPHLLLHLLVYAVSTPTATTIPTATPAATPMYLLLHPYIPTAASIYTLLLHPYIPIAASTPTAASTVVCCIYAYWYTQLPPLPLLPRKVWYDMEAIRTRFFDCPVEEIRLQALSMIAIEARSSASMKRKKQSNIRRAAKMKPGYKPPEKKAPRKKKAKKADDGDDANSALSMADSNADF